MSNYVGFPALFMRKEKINPWMFSLLYQFSSWDCLIIQPNFTESAYGT